MPDDIAALKALVLASQAELRNRDLLIEKLKHQLAGLRRQRFGATSEALDQLELEIEDEEIAQAAEAVPEPTPGTKRQPKRHPLPGHLPREETVLAPGEQCTDWVGKRRCPQEPLIETVRLNGIDPQAWLVQVLQRIPDYKINRVDELPP